MFRLMTSIWFPFIIDAFLYNGNEWLSKFNKASFNNSKPIRLEYTVEVIWSYLMMLLMLHEGVYSLRTQNNTFKILHFLFKEERKRVIRCTVKHSLMKHLHFTNISFEFMHLTFFVF